MFDATSDEDVSTVVPSVIVTRVVAMVGVSDDPARLCPLYSVAFLLNSRQLFQNDYLLNLPATTLPLNRQRTRAAHRAKSTRQKRYIYFSLKETPIISPLADDRSVMIYLFL